MSDHSDPSSSVSESIPAPTRSISDPSSQSSTDDADPILAATALASTMIALNERRNSNSSRLHSQAPPPLTASAFNGSNMTEPMSGEAQSGLLAPHATPYGDFTPSINKVQDSNVEVLSPYVDHSSAMAPPPPPTPFNTDLAPMSAGPSTQHNQYTHTHTHSHSHSHSHSHHHSLTQSLSFNAVSLPNSPTESSETPNTVQSHPTYTLPVPTAPEQGQPNTVPSPTSGICVDVVGSAPGEEAHILLHRSRQGVLTESDVSDSAETDYSSLPLPPPPTEPPTNVMMIAPPPPPPEGSDAPAPKYKPSKMSIFLSSGDFALPLPPPPPPTFTPSSHTHEAIPIEENSEDEESENQLASETAQVSVSDPAPQQSSVDSSSVHTAETPAPIPIEDQEDTTATAVSSTETSTTSTAVAVGVAAAVAVGAVAVVAASSSSSSPSTTTTTTTTTTASTTDTSTETVPSRPSSVSAAPVPTSSSPPPSTTDSSAAVPPLTRAVSASVSFAPVIPVPRKASAPPMPSELAHSSSSSSSSSSSTVVPGVAGAKIGVTQVTRVTHVTYDATTGRYQGLPKEWESALSQEFGIPIHLARGIQTEQYSARIPAVLLTLQKCIIDNGGLTQVGIFRLAPDKDECERVKQELNKGTFTDCKDAIIASNLIKSWFRELPAPLFSTLAVEDVQQVKSPEQTTAVIAKFPEPRQSVYRWLLDLSSDITAHHQENKMTAKNVAIVIAPNLYNAPTPKIGDAADALRVLNLCKQYTTFFELCIAQREAERGLPVTI